MATLRPPAPAVGSWEEPPPPPPRAAAPPPDDDGHNHHPKPPSSSTPSGARAPPPPPQQTTPKQTSVDAAAAELMSYLDSTSSALSASARAAEGEASEARQNALAALRIAQNYSSPSPRSFSGGAAAPPPPVLSVPPPPSSSSSPGGKKRKNPLLAAAAGVGAQVGVPAPTRAGPIAANFPPPPPSSLAAGTAAGHPTSYSAPVTPATAGAATPGTATSTSRLAQSHAEDVLSLALEVETLRSQLEAERESHTRTRSLLASEKSRSAELEGDLRFTKTELESTVERHRRESDRRTRESERAAARVAAAEEDAALALDLARAASDGRDQMEGWLGAAMAEIERLKGGGGGGGGDDGDGGAEGQSPEEAARQVRHEIEDEDGGGHQHERGAHPHNPGELLKRDSSIFHRHDSTSPERHQPRNDAGGPPSAEPAIFDPANASASASAGGGGGAIPEHASFDPLAPDDDGDDEGEEDMSSSYGAGYDDAPTDASLAGDAGDDADADASLTTVGTNPSLGTPGGGGFAFSRAYVFATGEEDGDGGEGGGGDAEEYVEEGEDEDNIVGGVDDGGGDPPASAAAAAAATPPTGNNGRRSGASRAMVAVGRDLLLRRTGATASGNAAGDPASRSPSSAAYRVSLARIAERRTRLHERLNRGAGADVELDGGRGDRASPSGMRDNSPRGEHVPQRGVNLGRHRIYLTSASADKVLELLRDSGRRLRLGRNFVLTDGDNLGGMDGLGGVRGGGMDGIGAGGDGGGSGSPGGDGGADEEDERMETGRSTLSNIEGIAANYCRAVEAKVNLQKEECRQLESLCEYLEGRVVESDFGQDLA